MKPKNHNLADGTSEVEHQLIACGELLKKHVMLTKIVVQQTALRAGDHVGEQATRNSRLKSYETFFSFEGSNVMRNTSLVTLAAIGLLVCVYWNTTAGMSFAQAIEAFQQVTSYVADISMENRDSRTSERVAMTGKLYWQAPDDFRSESKLTRTANPTKSVADNIEVSSNSKPGIRLNVDRKSYVELAPRKGAKSPLLMLQRFTNYQKVATKQLGSRSIHGVACTGFEINLDQVDPDAGGGMVEVWFDNKDRLPQYVVIHISTQFAPVDLIMQNFKWNESLSQELFSTAPPSDYSQEKSDEDRLSDEVVAEKIVEALRLYAELSGGSYPQVKVIYGDVVLAKLRQLSAAKQAIPPALGKAKTLIGMSHLIDTTAIGWAEANRIMREDSEAQYNGLTVSPSDNEKVLFKWRRTDGRYQVIYGDLRRDILAQ